MKKDISEVIADIIKIACLSKLNKKKEQIETDKKAGKKRMKCQTD
ncbi:hypothetical protein psyc5s11_32730 [Clostridium gelidum]|uniref:Uncharacterized protein n=1 Tax=Clostridium gelidum TaxID=704125 RepID=A0ABM7T833_9CLOT|nr:hypothetical protein [Clostridium gelidum]BCZ47206.1 hypothetical protein psyc5s11_32730 [Clostridium gelidum]